MKYIYALKNSSNGKIYVGQTKNVKMRIRGHFSCARKGVKNKLYDSIRYHGENVFKVQILEECNDELANERECWWIEHLDTMNSEKGYNMTEGGTGVITPSLETRYKMGSAHRGKHLTKLHRKRIGKAGKGKPKSEETRKRMQKSRTPEQRENYRLGALKRWQRWRELRGKTASKIS